MVPLFSAICKSKDIDGSQCQRSWNDKTLNRPTMLWELLKSILNRMIQQKGSDPRSFNQFMLCSWATQLCSGNLWSAEVAHFSISSLSHKQTFWMMSRVLSAQKLWLPTCNDRKTSDKGGKYCISNEQVECLWWRIICSKPGHVDMFHGIYESENHQSWALSSHWVKRRWFLFVVFHFHKIPETKIVQNINHRTIVLQLGHSLYSQLRVFCHAKP